MRKYLILSSIIGAAVLLAGCTSQSTTANQYPTPSPQVKGMATEEAVVDEGEQLKKLNQDAKNIDNSLNDRPITVK